MRKRFITNTHDDAPAPSGGWLDLEPIADVEITSEEAGYPIESALLQNGGPGWRAAHAGEQTIRIVFTTPRRIQRIWLEFEELESERTQQLIVRWLADGADSFREIVRQQWNFSPHGATSEIEDYGVDLSDAAAIELTIVPDITGGDARASLAGLRVA